MPAYTRSLLVRAAKAAILAMGTSPLGVGTDIVVFLSPAARRFLTGGWPSVKASLPLDGLVGVLCLLVAWVLVFLYQLAAIPFRDRELRIKELETETVALREQNTKVAGDLRRTSENREAEARIRLNKFRIVTCDLRDGRRVCLSWHGPLDELETLPTWTVTRHELSAIHCTLSKYESEPVQPKWEWTAGSEAVEVWEIVDENATQKRKLRSTRLNNVQDFLRAFPRTSTASSYCPQCGRISSGINCTHCKTVFVSCP